jgi:hypothetical protein
MPRNNEDARSGLDRADIPGFEGTMGMLDHMVSKYTPNMQKKKNREGEEPSEKDVNYATKFGKITKDEAKDLRPEDESFTPSIYSKIQTDSAIHKNAGLSKIKGKY